MNSSKSLCRDSDIFDNVECQNIFQPLYTRLFDIELDYNSISHLISTRTKRSAWFGGIGTLSKKLFGTMDEDDAIRYDKAINDIQDDQKEIALLMKQNILVTTNTLKSFNTTLKNIVTNEQQLNNAIIELSKDIKNLTTISRELGIRSRLYELIFMLENSLLALSFKVEDIVNGIMFSKSNVLHPTILTPKNLYNELLNSYRFLPNSKQLPSALTLDNIQTFLNISEVSSYYSNLKIVFVLKIPLVDSKTYNLFHNLPFPITHNINNPESYATIIPSVKYLGITNDKSTYCKIENINKCIIMYSNTYLCDMSITYSVAATPTCETELMTKLLTSIPEICETKIIHGNLEIWQALRNNKWLYVISQKSKLTLECNNSRTHDISISGSGLLYLPTNCIGYYKETRLISKSYINVKSQVVQSDFNLIKDECCNELKFQNLKENLPIVNLRNVNLDAIANYNKNNIVKDLDKIIDKPHIVLYGNYYSTLTSFVSILILLYIIFKIYKTSICKNVCKRKNIVESSLVNVETENIELPVIPAPSLKIV